MRCSSCAVSIVIPLVAYLLHVGFWPLPEHVRPAAIDTSAFDDLSPVDAAERLLELIAIPTVTQRAPLSNVSAALMLQLHQRKFFWQQSITYRVAYSKTKATFRVEDHVP
jgi:hypothetical protein